MARKFQIGDTVQVVWDAMHDDTPMDGYFKVGHRGVVTEYLSFDEFPYRVLRKNGNDDYFKARELKLIKKK